MKREPFTKRKKREQATKPPAPPVKTPEPVEPAECPDGGYHEDSSCGFCDDKTK